MYSIVDLEANVRETSGPPRKLSDVLDAAVVDIRAMGVEPFRDGTPVPLRQRFVQIDVHQLVLFFFSTSIGVTTVVVTGGPPFQLIERSREANCTFLRTPDRDPFSQGTATWTRARASWRAMKRTWL